MDFNPANTSPRPDVPSSPDSAGFEHELSASQALAEAPDCGQDRIWQEIASAPSRAEPPELPKLPISAAVQFGNTLNPN